MSNNFWISGMRFSWSNLRRVSSFILTIASIHSNFTIMFIGLLGERIQPFKFLIKTHALVTLQPFAVKETIVLPWYFSQVTCYANLFEWRQCWFEDKQISSHLHFTKKCAMLVYHHKLTSNTYNLHRFSDLHDKSAHKCNLLFDKEGYFHTFVATCWAPSPL